MLVRSSELVIQLGSLLFTGRSLSISLFQSLEAQIDRKVFQETISSVQVNNDDEIVRSLSSGEIVVSRNRRTANTAKTTVLVVDVVVVVAETN